MATKMKKLLATVLFLSMLFTCCMVPLTANAEESDDLKFDENGKFKIVIFSDTQDKYVVHPRLTNIMSQALRRENPDLVVFLGDQTEMNTSDPEVDFRRSLEQILAPVVEADVPYAFVFGNHDDQSAVSGTRADKDALYAVYQTIGDCRTTDPDPSLTGTGTCNIPIYSSDGSSVAFNLWMIDSNTYQNPTDGSGGYDNPHADQLAWMQSTQDALTASEGHVVPSVAFQHIPMPEIYNLLVEDPNGTNRYGGYYQRALNENATGYIGEFPCPCYPSNNTGEYTTLKNMGVLNLFTGHDHLNDFSGKYEVDGVGMTAVPGMTYLNYGDEEVRGYGVIELDEADLSDYAYHTVKFSELDEESHVDETYDVYDEITFTDLKKNGTALSGEYTFNGGNTFTYDATSPSYSAVLKVRWTAGSDTGIQFSFDKAGNSMTYPFGVWVKKVDSSNPTGAWHLKPDSGNGTLVAMKKAAQQGDTYDIEFGRLKVVTGAAEYVGQYYVYLKVNGKLITSGYSAVDSNGCYTSGNNDCQLSNQILFADWSSYGNKISAIPDDVEYPAEDIFHVDFSQGNQELGGLSSIAGTGSTVQYTKDATLNRQVAVFDGNSGLGYTIPNSVLADMQDGYTYEILYKLPSVPAGGTDLASSMAQGGFGTEYSPANNRFNYWQSFENDTKDYRQLYYNNGSNATNQWVHLVAVWDPEGNGGLGQLLGYLNGTYKDYSNPDSNVLKFNSNSFYIGGNTNSSGNFRDGTACEIAFVRIYDKTYSASEIADLYTTALTPLEDEGGGEEEEEKPDEDAGFDTYDKLTLSSFGLTPGNYENALPGNKTTYTATSASYSYVLKFYWRANLTEGSGASELCISPDGQWNHGYGLWFRGDGLFFCWTLSDAKTKLSAITSGDHLVEFGRKMVTEGENTGKYYVYVKVDDVLLHEAYTTYNSDSHTVNNMMYIRGADISNQRFANYDWPEEYEAYDEVDYSDLLKDGNPVSSETTLSGRTIFTYNRTSPTYSTILKYRWTAGDVAKFTLLFDQTGAYPFTLVAKYPNQDNFGTVPGANGAWQIDPTQAGNLVNLSEALVPGRSYDIEYGRLKVKKGANAGKYYVYLKVDGEDITSYYYNGVDANGSYYNGCQLSNNIVFEVWGASGTKISSTPEVETYEAYDEIGYEDLLKDNVPVGTQTALSGGSVLTYNKTSPSGSAILKFNWTVGSIPKFQLSFDKVDATTMDYMFGAQLEQSSANYSNGNMWLRPGYGPSVNLPTALSVGSSHNVEFARLKVANGTNAGKYYVYIKIDDVLIAEDYVAADVVDSNGQYVSNPHSTTCSLSNEILFTFWGSSGNVISAYTDGEQEVDPNPDALYYDYDEINYEDLYKNGTPVGEQTSLSGGNVLTYNKTSPTGSVILKYRWTVGTIPKFQISFDKTSGTTMNYLFGVQFETTAEHPNGYMWLQPGTGAQIDLDEALQSESKHDIEFARLKVKNGENAGKYYVYIKIDDQIIAETYVAAGVVNSNGQYVSNPGSTTCTLSNEIVLTFWGSDGNKLSSAEDVIIIGDLNGDEVINATDLAHLKQIILGLEEVTESIAVLADMNEDDAIDVRDVVAMKKYLAIPSSLNMVSMQIGAQPSERTVVWYSDATDIYSLQLAEKADMTGRRFPTEYTSYVAATSAPATSTAGVTSKLINEVSITGLQPNTEYVYRIGAGEQWSQIYTFETQDFDSGSFTFLVAGDSQLGIKPLETDTANWADTIEKGLEVASDASFLLSLGDQTDAPYLEQYQAFLSPDTLKSLPIATAVGNHELGVNYGNFFKMPNVSEYGVSSQVGSGSGDYWFIYNGVLFMTLNSNNKDVSEHEQFLTETIAAHPEVRWKVVSMHHSLFSMANSYYWDELVPFRDALAPILSDLDIDVVLSAHDHNYSRTYMMEGTTPVIPEGGVPSGVTDPEDGQVLYVSFSSSSGSLFCGYESGEFPFCAVRQQSNVPNISTVSVTNTSFTITTYRTDDMSVIDTFTINKSE